MFEKFRFRIVTVIVVTVNLAQFNNILYERHKNTFLKKLYAIVGSRISNFFLTFALNFVKNVCFYVKIPFTFDKNEKF